MSTSAEHIIVAGAENGPPMLDKSMYNSLALRFPSTNNQLRTSSNSRNQSTIQDGRVTVQQVQGRQGKSFAGTRTKGNATKSEGNNAASQARVVKCYNCQGEGHMARQCTQSKRSRNFAWFKEKIFGNDQITKIMGYGDYQIGNVTISRVYYVERGVATACYTQNRTLIRKSHNKTPYELLHNKKLELSYLYVFGALCYPTNDSKDLGKLKPKADIEIFIGYAPIKKAYRIYNKRTRLIIETVHVHFDELTAMDSKQFIVALEPADSTGTPSSNSIDQDAPSSKVLKEAYWIEAMQEELNKFEHLKVWEPASCPDHVMIITLKWIFKVKFDELGGVLENKSRLVAMGYRQEEAINFEEYFSLVA
nr:retrovirus-related Pol polyprotein from transposon TNT 1-94 [Tanacetum cinerariifolium]